MGTHFVVEDGKWTTYIGKVHEAPDVEFAFPDLKKFIIFFAGKGMPLPKIKGLTKLGILVPVLMTLLRMAGLLQATEIPKKPEDQEMLVRLYFYLLVTAMSQLNKAGHPAFKAVTEHSPDRCYALKVSGYPELQSYIRMKQGNTKAGRGEYPRCKPFLTMIFDIRNTFDTMQEKQKPEDRRSRAERIFVQYIQLVERNYKEQRQVQWYASQMDLSPKYLCEAISAVSRRSPNEWIDKFVTTEIRNQLRHTNKRISEIAAEMHFPTQSFFGKYFKDNVGVSPTDYRNGIEL